MKRSVLIVLPHGTITHSNAKDAFDCLVQKMVLNHTDRIVILCGLPGLAQSVSNRFSQGTYPGFLKEALSDVNESYMDIAGNFAPDIQKEVFKSLPQFDDIVGQRGPKWLRTASLLESYGKATELLIRSTITKELDKDIYSMLPYTFVKKRPRPAYFISAKDSQENFACEISECGESRICLGILTVYKSMSGIKVPLNIEDFQQVLDIIRSTKLISNEILIDGQMIESMRVSAGVELVH
jgi:hypothetical protein